MLGETGNRPSREDEATEAIIAILGQLSAGRASGQIGSQTRLIDGGLLDSLAVLQLVLSLGDKMGVEIGDEDFTPEHFATVGSLARFVAGKSPVSG